MGAEYNKLRTGVELLLTLQLALEIMDEYNLKGLVKKKANMFKQELEKDLNPSYDKVYMSDPELVMNCMNLKHRMISQIASLDENYAMAMSEHINKFFESEPEEVLITKQGA